MRLKFLKPDKYLTRRLLAGEELELPDTKAGRLHARVYLSKRTAKEMRPPADVPPPPPAVAEKIAAATISLPAHVTSSQLHNDPPPKLQEREPPKPAPASRPLPATSPRPPAPPPATAAGVTGNVASGEGGAPPTTVGAMTTTSQPALVPGGASGVGQHVQPTRPRARAKSEDESGI